MTLWSVVRVESGEVLICDVSVAVRVKRKVYKSLLSLALMYASETLALTKKK